MNNCAPTYQEFQGFVPLAGISASDYEVLLPKAEMQVDSHIFPNSVDDYTPAPVLNAYKKAIANVVIFNNDNPAGVSTHYSAGKVSETLESSSVYTRNDIMNDALCGSGLLCRWL